MVVLDALDIAQLNAKKDVLVDVLGVVVNPAMELSVVVLVVQLAVIQAAKVHAMLIAIMIVYLVVQMLVRKVA